MNAIVRSCYRVLLGREPEDEDVVRRIAEAGDLEPILQKFMQSAEFRGRFNNYIV
jgi:hypothetical protein